MSRGLSGVKLLALYRICYNMKDFLGSLYHRETGGLEVEVTMLYAQEIP